MVTYSAAANRILHVVSELVSRPERDGVISESIKELCISYALLTGKPLTVGMIREKQEKERVNRG